MKRLVYIFCFTLLGGMLGFFLHMILEVTYLNFLLADFGKYGFGWSWRTWENVHAYGTLFLVLFGLGLGYRCGVRCWKWLYIEQRLLKRWGVKLKKDF